MKKKFSLFIFLIICLSFFSNIVQAKVITIKDVPNTDDSYSQIQWVLNQGYMGLSIGKFMPNSYLKRNEFTVILAKINGDIKSLEKPSKATFKDVSTKDQFFRYIETEKDYMTLFKNSKGLYFKPLSYITREDAAMSIVRIMGYDSDDAISQSVDSEVSLDEIIQDADKVSPAIEKYVSLAVQNQLLSLRQDGDNSYFDPKNNITRKQLAVLIYNAYQNKDFSKADDTTVIVPDNSKDSTSSLQNINVGNQAQNQSTEDVTTTGSVQLNSLVSSVTTVAGNSSSSTFNDYGDDGDLLTATFKKPVGVAVDSLGNIYVADNAMTSGARKISTDGKVTSIKNAILTTDVKINKSDGRVYFMGKDLYAVDNLFTQIKDMDSNGTCFASSIAFDNQGHILGTEKDPPYNLLMLNNGFWQYISGININGANHIAVDSNNNIYITDSIKNVIYKVSLLPIRKVEVFAGTEDKAGFIDGPVKDSLFNSPTGIAIDNQDNIYVCDSGNNTIRKITKDGNVITLVGNPPKQSSDPLFQTSEPGKAGYKDGNGTDALFSEPTGICIDNDGNLIVADTGNCVIRKIILKK